MKIVRQLANWLLENDRIDLEEYQKVLAAIQGGMGDGEGKLLRLADMRQRDRDAVEDSAEDWWSLRGAGGRAKASHRKGGRKAAHNTKPIKVDELDPILSDKLLPQGAAEDAFPLADLLIAVDDARGNRHPHDWAGFAAAATALYKIGAEELHDAVLAAMRVRGRELGDILAAAEQGSSLFPEGFLSDLSGESVTALLKHIAGEETDFAVDKAGWILRYPSFNVVNEACLVRNRIRRIYRLWVKTLADWDACGAANHGTPGVCLAFGRTLVHVPAIIWWKLQDPNAPHIGSASGMIIFKIRSGGFLNALLDGAPAVFYKSQCIEPPETPCQFGWIQGEGLDDIWPRIQVIWPIAPLKGRSPVLSLSAATETVYWTPESWAAAMAERMTLSNGVPAENMCPWHALHTYLSADGWANLWLTRRDLVKEFPWDLIDPNEISEGTWLSILTAYPEYAGRAPWKKFGAPMLDQLFSERPDLAGCCDSNAIDVQALVTVLENNPKCVGPCLQNLTDCWKWLGIAPRHPSWLAHCPWQSLPAFAESVLLKRHPEYIPHCDLSRINGSTWREILIDNPQLANYCDWGKLKEDDWKVLLRSQPQLSVYRPDKTS